MTRIRRRHALPNRPNSLTTYVELTYGQVMAERIRMTRTTRDVLHVLLDGSREDLHGLEICRRTGLGSGTVYPILARLERAGWLSTRWEDEESWQNPEDGRRRPRRRFYTLTGEGSLAAGMELDSDAAERRPRLGYGQA